MPQGGREDGKCQERGDLIFYKNSPRTKESLYSCLSRRERGELGKGYPEERTLLLSFLFSWKWLARSVTGIVLKQRLNARKPL